MGDGITSRQPAGGYKAWSMGNGVRLFGIADLELLIFGILDIIGILGSCHGELFFINEPSGGSGEEST